MLRLAIGGGICVGAYLKYRDEQVLVKHGRALERGCSAVLDHVMLMRLCEIDIELLRILIDEVAEYGPAIEQALANTAFGITKQH